MNKSEWIQYLQSQAAHITTHTNEALAENFAATTATSGYPQTFVTPLLHLGLMSIEGNDSQKFLQGQLTCDVKSASPMLSILGAACNPQGRMFTSFRLLQGNNEAQPHYFMRMRSNIVESTRETLSKYIVFFKSKLVNADQQWMGIGVWGEQSSQIIAELTGTDSIPQEAGQLAHTAHAMIIRLPGEQPRFECWVTSEQAIALWENLARHAQPVSTHSWILEDIRCGLGDISVSTANTFIPHMLNYPAVKAVSFKKGCYTGQEIVARTEYRGKTKRVMQRFLLSGAPALQAGTELHQPGSDRAVATVISAAPCDQTGNSVDQEALLVINTDSLENASLALCHEEQCFDAQQMTLPYTL